jgi:hypothetical protein
VRSTSVLQINTQRHSRQHCRALPSGSLGKSATTTNVILTKARFIPGTTACSDVGTEPDGIRRRHPGPCLAPLTSPAASTSSTTGNACTLRLSGAGQSQNERRSQRFFCRRCHGGLLLLRSRPSSKGSPPLRIDRSHCAAGSNGLRASTLVRHNVPSLSARHFSPAE